MVALNDSIADDGKVFLWSRFVLLASLMHGSWQAALDASDSFRGWAYCS